jgi:hypothetical protein
MSVFHDKYLPKNDGANAGTGGGKNGAGIGPGIGAGTGKYGAGRGPGTGAIAKYRPTS